MGAGITYEEFTEKVLKAMDAYAGEEGRATLHKVRKNNGIELSGISIFREGSNLSPTIYLEEYYERYINGENFGELMLALKECYEMHQCSRELDFSFYSDYEKVRGKLAYKLINREKNEELLREIPYIDVLNLAVVFFCRVDHEAIGNGSILVRSDHLKMWQVTAETVYRDAMENTARFYPLKVYPMAELLEEYTGKPLDLDPIPMYVMTNEQKLYGAGVLLYEGVMKTMAAQLDSDLVILPSSVHEVIVLPVEDRNEALGYESMVSQINATQVAYEEILSDQVYYFDRETEELTMAQETEYL